MIPGNEQERERKRGTAQPVCLLSLTLCSTGSQGKLQDERKTSPSSSQTTPPSAPSFPSTPAPQQPSPPAPHAPNIFNYIFSQVLRLSNQGADIDACADKSANTGNKINKDFEERVTANFAQWSAPHSRVMFLIERATPENSCSTQGRRGREHSARSSAAFALFKLFLFSNLLLSPSLQSSLLVLHPP